jgi:hypothetical protein
LLSKGLKFCPNPPKINIRELDEDLDQFARRLRIKEYFHSKKETSEDLSTDESNIKEVIDIPRADLCTSTLCLISDLIRSMTDSSLVFLLGFGIQILFLTNLGISMTSFMFDSSVDRS